MTLHYPDYPDHINQLIEAALAAADPATAVQRHLHWNGRTLAIGQPIIHTHHPSDGRIYLISVGKAAVPMALAAAQTLGERLHAGVIIAKRGEHDWQSDIAGTLLEERRDDFPLYTASHPLSDEIGVQATTAVHDLLTATTAHDLVLCLISGGASALLTQPILPLSDWQQLTQALLKSGCTINELNRVRRQLDRVKGGGLAQWAAPATCVALILSDVVGSPLEAIGSGPTVHTTETLADAVSVLARYQVGNRLETAVWQRIIQTMHQMKEQPIPEAAPAYNLIIGDVRQAAQAAQIKAAQLGFTPHLITAQLEGEAREV
ncbi:MAG: glycerate-2-kinase family protein, partial [Anaerolineales bacterium]|nr:glycerate-2-kinase family protein [Anaerolineales bacterium]